MTSVVDCPLLLGIDIGTTGCKCGLVDLAGEVLALSYQEYPTLNPQPGWAELDSDIVWNLLVQFSYGRCLPVMTLADIRLKKAIAETVQGASGRIVALCVTSCGEAAIPVSAERNILGPAILNYDIRGEEYVEHIRAEIGGDRVHELNGNILHAGYTAPKLAWVREHQPGLFRETYKFLLWGGLVGFLLGGEATTDTTLASRTLLLDLETSDWSEEMLSAWKLPRNKLPKIVQPGTVTGTVSDSMACELGLPNGVVIVAGGHDQCCTALGAGVVAPGQALYGMGTYTCLAPTFPRPSSSGRVAMLARGLNIEPHVVSGLYMAFFYNMGGGLMRWARDVLAEGRTYDVLVSEFPKHPTRGMYVLPNFAQCGPPTFDPHVCGCFVGLHLSTTRGEVVKSLMEGASYVFRNGLDLLRSTGIEVSHLRATGGGAKSPALLQLTADILAQPVSLPFEAECGVVGAAMLAGNAVGLFGNLSLPQIAEKWVKLKEKYRPNPVNVHIYEQKVKRHSHLQEIVTNFLHEISAE